MTGIRSSRPRLIAAIGLVAAAGLGLTACNNDGADDAADGAVAASTSAASSAAPSTAGPMDGMPGMAGMPVAQVSQYDPANKPGAAFYASVLSGLNEIPDPAGKKTGDKDGNALALMRIQGDEVSFAFAWSGIDTPTAGHIHEGRAGTDGDVKIPFFTAELPDGKSMVYGTVKVPDQQLLSDLAARPQDFYFNLHTAEFNGGAVRGQVFGLPMSFDLLTALKDTSVKSVQTGRQIYACTEGADGTWSFTQDNVDATLQGGIRHTFKKAGPAGPPQWQAPDGSAVTGRTVSKIDNGPANIPVLALQATQEGAQSGLLAHTDAVFRLNTRGGVAPKGSCDPQARPTAQVPYAADYLFLAGLS